VNVTTIQSISSDLLDLFDDSGGSDVDGRITLVEMCPANKKRKRKLLKSVKQLSRERENDAKQKDKQRKRDYLQIDTAKQDLAGQKKITDASFNGMETPHMFREDMRTDSLARRKWLCLLFVQNAKGDKVNILDNYMRISAVDTQES